MTCRIGSLVVVGMLGVVAFGCGDSYDGSPTTPSTPALVSMEGSVLAIVAIEGAPIVGATVTILDGANAGRTATTDSEGQYQFQGLTQGNANFSVRAPGFLEQRNGGVIHAADYDPITREWSTDRADWVLQPAP